MEVNQDSRALDRGSLAPVGLPAIKSVICGEVAESVAGAYGSRMRALILTGSMARDEAAVAETDGTKRLLGDAEFLLVFAEGAGLPEQAAISRLAREIEDRLARHGIQVSMDLDAVHPGFLRALTPCIFAYELRSCGQVVWGDQGILSLIPAFTGADIPLEDAWRLLCNRMIEQLELAAEFDAQPGILPPAVHYRTVKLYRDMATSFLVFAGAYEPTYRGRAERLRSLAADPSKKWALPFPLAGFSNRVSACTNFKMQGSCDGAHEEARHCPPSFAFWRDAATQARSLWSWELVQLTGGGAPLSDQELMKKWMKLQPVRDRVRGWAYVLRQCGWHRSWQEWPRWLRLGRRASPRYCVYAAASKLFFQLPCAIGLSDDQPSAKLEIDEIRSWLPMDRHYAEDGKPGWQKAAAEIGRNYRRFLTGARV